MIKNMFYYHIGIMALIFRKAARLVPFRKRSYTYHDKKTVKKWESMLEKCGVNPDIIVPQKKLERSGDLKKGLADIAGHMTKNEVFVSLVDLKTRNTWLAMRDPLNIYRFNQSLWDILKSRGCPLRVHASEYRRTLEQNGWADIMIKPIEFLDDESLASVKPYLAKQFRTMDDRELRILSFFLLARKR